MGRVGEKMFYRIVYWPVWIVFHIVYRMRVTGCGNVPKKGPVILCVNHTSYADPVSVAMAIRRKPNFMAKQELFDFKPLGLLIRSLGAYPVSRGTADMGMFRNSVRILKDGGLIIIFVQGGRRSGTDFSEAKAGAALLAIKTGAAMVPVAVSCTYKWFSRLRIKIGAPVNLEEYAGRKVKTELLNEITEKTVAAITELLQGEQCR